MKLIRKYLIYSHRYLGIAVSLLVVMWFASGIVMMYSGGMPRLSPEMRLDRMEEIDLAQVRLTPVEAAEAVTSESGGSGKGPGAGRGSLQMVLGRPAYRIAGTNVFADTGEVLSEVNLDQARAITAAFARVPLDKVRHVETLEKIDQWTLQSRLPLYKFAVDDGAGTEIYIQPRTGEVAMHTTSRARMLAWMGTIPHWFYFTALRGDQPLWYKLVVWTSALVCVLAVLGLVIGTVLLRRPKPGRLSSAIPYSGWTRWHYITGLVFGFFTLTWAFSGLLSMEPFEWTRAEGLQVRANVFTGGQADLNRFAKMDAAKWMPILDGRPMKEVSFIRIDGRDYYDVRTSAPVSEEEKRERLHQPYPINGRTDENRLLVSADSLEVWRDPIPTGTLMAKLTAALPEAPVVEHEVLTKYDSYYYSRGGLKPLPVLRVKFGDPAETWMYIDPEMGQVLASIPRLARVERWFYNGLHSLDFSFWYDKRPLWDIGMLALLGGGLFSSSIGLVMGFRRLIRALIPSKVPSRKEAPAPVGVVRT